LGSRRARTFAPASRPNLDGSAGSGLTFARRDARNSRISRSLTSGGYDAPVDAKEALPVPTHHAGLSREARPVVAWKQSDHPNRQGNTNACSCDARRRRRPS
jgi:hypothetical protein